jgi:hypothetical protein
VRGVVGAQAEALAAGAKLRVEGAVGALAHADEARGTAAARRHGGELGEGGGTRGARGKTLVSGALKRWAVGAALRRSIYSALAPARDLCRS